jgi:hypothetical protein
MGSGSDVALAPPEYSVERGRDAYLAENGFGVETYTAKYTPASFMGIPLSIPNTKRHQWAIRLHDLHHVATGYGTDMAGEAEISAWEARRGVRSLGLYVGAIVVSLALFGLVFAPRRTIAAWRTSGSSARSLFGRDDLDYDALLRMSVAELRAELHVPAWGIAQQQHGLHALAPKA